MGFFLQGNFSAYLCRNFHEALNGVFVKIYLPHNTPTTKEKTKYALELSDDGTVLNKKKHLLGEGKTDALGNYEIELSDHYNGGPITYDIEVTAVPSQKMKIDKKVQFTVTTLQPVWRDNQQDKCYNWHYCLPYKFWGGVRTTFDAWMVCGHVKSSTNRRAPLVGAKVFAYDADWIKDDFLGVALTDESGFFRIDYSSVDFKKTFLTPLINVETPFSPIPGPGVYFKVASNDGQMLLEEGRAEGKMTGRRNVPNCFGIDLFVDDYKVKNT